MGQYLLDAEDPFPAGFSLQARQLMPARDDEVQALVEQLSAELDRSVLVDDASLRLLAYSPTLGSEDEVRGPRS